MVFFFAFTETQNSLWIILKWCCEVLHKIPAAREFCCY